jgi:putative endonuclease
VTASTKAKSEKKSDVRRAGLGRATQTEFFVYIARCSDASLYTGYTTDPGRRIGEHNRGVGSRYTRSRRPVELVYLKRAASRSDALRLEGRIKKLNKREKLLLCEEYKREEKPS